MKTKKFSDLICKIIIICIVPITLFLFVTSSLFRFDSLASENYYFAAPIFLIFIPVILFLSHFLGKLLHKAKKKISFIDWIIACVLTIIWSFVAIMFVNGAKELPGSDALSCFELAKRFLSSDFSAVVPKDSYLSLWPFQCGLIFILEKTMRLFNTTDPFFFQRINVLFCALGFLSGFGILKEMTDNENDIVAFFLLAFSDLVLVIECPHIYGNIPCFNLLVFATWMIIKSFKSDKKILKAVYGILGLTALLAACVYKGNALIFVIALVIFSFSKLLENKKNLVAFIIVLVASAVCFISGSLFTKYYESYAGNTMGKGVPKIAYVAMGLQGSGGWNGFHSNTFMETGYDYEETTRISKKSIEESLKNYIQNPDEAVKFIFTKNIRQWSYETRAVYWNLNIHWEEPRSELAVSAESGKLKKIIENISDVRLSLIYFFIIAGLIVSLTKKNEEKRPFTMLGALYFLGGFLFLCIWEAHAEYTVSYQSILLPLTLPLGLGWFRSLFSDKKTKN